MRDKFPGVTILIDQEHVIDGIKFYGSPWQPWYYDWAFNFRHPTKPMHGVDVIPEEAEEALRQAKDTWAKIPDDTRVLITHGPPFGILDAAEDQDKCGCPLLAKRITELLNLRLHVFGHIHEAYGSVEYKADDGSGDILTFVNAAICDLSYNPTHKPIVVDI